MSGIEKNQLLTSIEAILAPSELRDVLGSTAEQLGFHLQASRVMVLPFSVSGQAELAPVEWSLEEPDPNQDTMLLRLGRGIQEQVLSLSAPLVVHDVVNKPIYHELRSLFDPLDIRSLIAVTTRYEGVPNATILIYQTHKTREWSEREISFVSEVAYFASISIHRALKLFESRLETDTYRNALASSKSGYQSVLQDANEKQTANDSLKRSEQRYRRLVEHSDAIIFHTDPQQIVTFISRRSLDFVGVSPEDFTTGSGINWIDLTHPDDRERLVKLTAEMARVYSSFDEEIRVINRVTGRVRWLLVRMVPVLGESGEIEGWDGFGIDITARREAQEALDIQSKKVRALYTVSSAIRGYLDPANIASRGVAALCEATGADAGLCYLYAGRKDALELVAHHGFSAMFSERIHDSSTLPGLSHYVADNVQSIVVPDIRNDPRASRALSEEEGMRSAVLVPVCAEDETLGSVALFSRNLSRFHGGDVMLVSAAANQIGLAARQANLFSAYRKQTKNLAALYRLSHELTRNLSLDEIFQQAFGIIREELGVKRLWLGLLNELGTRIIGQAAYGPGWKRRLVEINVDINDIDHPIGQVIKARQAIVVDNPAEVLSEFGVRRVFSRLGIRSVALVPLVAGGVVLGVLAVQPSFEDSRLRDEDLSLLGSLANEIGAILLTKRLEDRVGESEKMRTAGLLAAGIAHNFNNLLQAILGQASLLEMQAEPDPKTARAAKIINEAATKGAQLVKQLLSFAHLEEPHKEVCDINEVIRRGLEGVSRNLREKIALSIRLAPELPKGLIDPQQLQRVLVSVVNNGVEAITGAGQIEVFSDSVIVGENSPHLEVPYGRYVTVGIRDSGKGMDDDTRKRCFEPFFTTKNVDPGTGIGMSGAGLGLAAAYALIRKNGGRLVVESRVGHGSVFTIYIPVADEVEKPDTINRIQNASVSVRTNPTKSNAARELPKSFMDEKQKVASSSSILPIAASKESSENSLSGLHLVPQKSTQELKEEHTSPLKDEVRAVIEKVKDHPQSFIPTVEKNEDGERRVLVESGESLADRLNREKSRS